MEMDHELSPEEESKLLDYLNSSRHRMAVRLSADEMQAQQREDLAPIREGLSYGLKKIDSVTGAPTRRAVSELLAGDKPGSVSRVVDQFGADADTAPTWPDLAEQAGVENETVKKGVGLVGPFLEPNLPIGPIAGMAKKIGKGGKVIDFAKELEAAGGPKPVDKVAQMHGETGKIIGVAEDTLPAEAKSKYGIDQKLKEGFKKQEAEAKKMREEPSIRDQFLNRFDNQPEIELAVERVEKSGKNPYATTGESGLVNQIVPKFNFEAGKEIGHRGIMHNVSPATDIQDPLPWMDTKFEITKNALKNAKGPVRVNTSSDLIARGDYIEALPEGSKVRIYGLSGNEHLNRLLFPGNPSQKRLEVAVKRLESTGVDVKMIQPTVEEFIERALARNPKNQERITQVTGLSEESLKRMLKESGLRESRLTSVEIDPFGQKAKSERVRPKQNRGPDDE